MRHTSERWATLRVSVIIPTLNGEELLSTALNSLQRQTFNSFEVIVVDNGSTDGTRRLLDREYPDVQQIRFNRNRGFAAAVNAGIQAAKGEILVLMNNDTEASPTWLESLVSALDRYPEVGFCASKMMSFHDRDVIDSAGDEFGLLAQPIGHGEPDDVWAREPRFVASACAGAAAYRRKLFNEIGLFDERFVTYLEDVDLGLRAQLAGYKCLYVPDAVIYHLGSATAHRMSEVRIYYLLRNSLFLFFQYGPWPRMIRWGPVMLIWPFVYTLREHYPVWVAIRAVADFFRDLPAVVRRRRQVWRTRQIALARFDSILAPPNLRAHQRIPKISVSPVSTVGETS